MKKILTLLTLLASGLLSLSAAERREIKISARPESVTKGFDGHYYVTVMNDNNISGDGTIQKVVGDKVEQFASGLDNPKGIVFIDGHLITADMKKVWKVNAKGQKTVLAEENDFPFPLGMLNDVAIAPDGKAVIISDMGANTKMRDPQGQLWPLDSPEAKALPAIGRIYRVTLDGKVTVVVDANAQMPCPNGVTAPDKDTVLIGEFFTGNLISVRDGQRKILATGYRGADGIECDKDGNIYLSSVVAGKIWKLDSRGQNPAVFAEGFKSAADFYLDADAKQIVLPDLAAGTLNFLPLK